MLDAADLFLLVCRITIKSISLSNVDKLIVLGYGSKSHHQLENFTHSIVLSFNQLWLIL
jgi:hypothetical protein